MSRRGKLLDAGGGNNPPTNTAEIIDLNQPNPTWANTGSMAYARRQTNATLLPTGDVLVTGGTRPSGVHNTAGGGRCPRRWGAHHGAGAHPGRDAPLRAFSPAS